jgi:2-(1,2-epoxy-1,2-dihydrophenyl)acetyl-CoA isomerase
MSDHIVTSITQGVARITLNRPDKLNAFAGDMRERLHDAIVEVGRSSEARVLVLTGAGRAFSAGGDIQHMIELRRQGAGFEGLEPLLAAGRAVVTAIDRLPIPTIAAVNGPAAGAGLNLALACDLRIASEQATFGETFARIGLHPDWGGSYTLPRRVGLSKALELCWTAEVIDAAEALRIGLVDRVVSHDRFAAEVEALATRIAAAPPASVQLAKQTLRASLHRTLEQCLDAEDAAQARCWATGDVTEGLQAFVEKRSPRFAATDASTRDGAEALSRFE